MSIVEPTLLSLARAAVVSLATLLVLLLAGSGVRSVSATGRALVFWLSMATLLTPGFAIAFLHFGSAMKHDAFEREQYYCLLVWLRYSPLALLMVWLMPPALSNEALHCLRIGTSLPWWRRRVWELRAWGRGLWLGVAIVFLLAFQEFEIATTWNLRAWPVALFDAQAGGLALGESLKLAALPFVLQAMLVALLARSFQLRAQIVVRHEKETERSTFAIIAVAMGFMYLWMFSAMAAVTGTSILTYLTRMDAFAVLRWREIGNGLGLSAAATALAWLLAGWLENRRSWQWLLALPGLFGPMLCGLLLLTLLQVPPFHFVRDTVFPPVIGLALVLLPLALLLRFGIGTTRDKAALAIARASGARLAAWQLDGWPRLCAMLMLFCFGYGDFTINALLAPPQFTSPGARLLNLLHYGRSDALMTMFLLAFAPPLTAALLTALIARFYPLRRAS